MEGKKRVMLCPTAGGSHITPMLVLARRLANLDVPITILCISKSCYRMVHQEVDGQDGIEVELLDGGEEGATHVKRTVMNGVRNESFGRKQPFNYSIPSPANQIALESKLKQLISDGLAPAAVITDFLLDWASKTVRSVGLPSYILYTCGALYIALSFHLKDLHTSGIGPKPLELMPPVSGLPSFPWDLLADFFYDQNDPMYIWMHNFDMELVHSNGILINTFDQMEEGVLEAIRSRIPVAKCLSEKIYTVGPLIGAEYVNGIAAKGFEEEPSLKWMDKQKPSSVLYISFGSWTAINEQQIIELAFGLLAAGKPYLWVLPEEFNKFLPSELKEAGNGYIIQGWAPQKLILGHRSIGAFLTHCGWNSVIEAVTLGGIPIIAWPFTIDQPLNARYLIDELKIAVDVHEESSGLVKREEVQRAVLELLEGPESQEFVDRAKKLQIQAKQAVSDNGPSFLHLHKFVNGLSL